MGLTHSDGGRGAPEDLEPVRLTREPEDARRGFVAPSPHDPWEAAADREMADAERAVVEGEASEEQTARVHRLAGARTQEERRARWMGREG